MVVKNATIKIFRGNDCQLPPADANIIIDVLRAFTTTFYAFQQGVKAIYLVNEIEQGLQLKNQLPNALVAGEIGGYKIEAFDLGNSPSVIRTLDLREKLLILKTSNGVKATLNSLNAKMVFVTGFVNVDSLIQYLENQIQKNIIQNINIVASDPISEDDWACGQYIQSKLLLDGKIDKKNCIERIKKSRAAAKFLDKKQKNFPYLDLALAVKWQETAPFLMKVEKDNKYIKILPLMLKTVG